MPTELYRLRAQDPFAPKEKKKRTNIWRQYITYLILNEKKYITDNRSPKVAALNCIQSYLISVNKWWLLDLVSEPTVWWFGRPRRLPWMVGVNAIFPSGRFLLVPVLHRRRSFSPALIPQPLIWPSILASPSIIFHPWEVFTNTN